MARTLIGYEKKRAVYQANLDLTYLLQIKEVYGSDQYFRRFDTDTSLVAYLKQDSLMFKVLKKLIAENGYPNQGVHGFDDNEIDAMLLHYSVGNEERMRETLDLLEKEHKNSLVRRSFMATIIDRYRMWSAQIPQQFGMWNSFRDKGKFSAIETMKGIDEKRFAYNLLRLQEQADKEDRAIPEGYTPSPYPANYFCGFKVDFE